MSKFGANLPAVLIPDGEICVNVTIPNHPDYVKLFLRAVRMLEVNRMYARDATMEGAKIVVEQWRNRTITPLIESLALGTGCPDENPECLEYPAYSGFVHYFPDSPYVDDEPNPPGYLLPAWWRWGTLDTVLPDWLDDFLNHQIEQFTGYKNNDAICWISSLLSLNIPAWLGSGYAYPAIEIELSGSGTAEICLLSFPLGSRAIVELDEKSNIIDIILGGIIDPNAIVVDTARDVLSFPPEEFVEVRVPVEVPEDGDHTIYIQFLPVVDPELSEEIIGFGGGIRSLELCGNLRPRGTPESPPPPPLEGVTELKPEFRFTADCGMEYRLRDQDDNIVQDWTPVAGWVDNAALCFTPEGGGMATKDDIRDGIYEAFNRLAAQVVSGGFTGFSVDEDGVVTVGGDGVEDVELPEDDPDTGIDETASAKMGGALDVAALCENVLEKIDALYGATNGTPTYSAAEAETVMSQIWDFDAALLNAAITNYYSYRATNPRFLWVKVASFALYIYCNGVSARTVSTYLIEVIAFTFAKQNAMLKFWNALTVAAYAAANEKGLGKPSTQYLDASCVPVAEQTLTNLLFAAARTTTPLKANHRMLMIVDGYALDTDGDVQDFFWFRTAAGVNTFTTPSFVHGAGSNLPSQNQVVYSASHHYEYTIDLSNLNAIMTITMNKHANMNATGLTYPVPFEITLIDLGEYLV